MDKATTTYPVLPGNLTLLQVGKITEKHNVKI